MQEKYYVINVPKVVDEIFEDEIIIINFDNGDYFSLRQSAIDIWKGIKNGHNTRLILNNLQQQYDADTSEIKNILLKQINDFLNEGLISESSGTAENLNTIIQPPEKKQPLKTPIFEKFTDMNDLLLLDPVHDVDEKGWPHIEANE